MVGGALFDDRVIRKLQRQHFGDPTDRMVEWGSGPDKQWRWEMRIAIYAADLANEIEKHPAWTTERLASHRTSSVPRPT